MRVTFAFVPLSPTPDARVSGTVTDTAGNPLVRRVILYDAALRPIAGTWSDTQGRASFTVTGRNTRDRFVVRAVGNTGECDDISCPVRAEFVN